VDTTGTTDLAALRARLAAAELGLSQTQTELSSARHTIAERDAAAAVPAPCGALDTAARAPAGAGGGGGAALDGAAAALGAPAERIGDGGAVLRDATVGGGDFPPPAIEGAAHGGTGLFDAGGYLAAADDNTDGPDDGTDWGPAPRGRFGCPARRPLPVAR